MSEENYIKEIEKFKSLKDLIQEYFRLVQNHKDGLPPYATFITYLKDDDKGKGFIDRPRKVKELVDTLKNDANDENKIDAILKLWACDKKSTVLHKDFNQNHPQLIHSITPRANTIATKYDFKEDDNCEDQKKKILDFIRDVIKLINFWNIDDVQVSIGEDFLELGSAEKELLFWCYYDEDYYPIINQRAKNSKAILANIFNLKFENDLAFNKQCMRVENFESIKREGKIYISKQLMLDQLFYSIDEMKSMKQVNEFYKSDKDNEIYKFYVKLWNTIKEAKRIMMKEDLDIFKNIIYHGAPGTGKTYELKKEIQEHLDFFEGGKSEFIQFHSAYTYEDFIGGLRPDAKSNNGLNLTYQNGIFKQLCKEAARYEIAFYTHDDFKDSSINEVEFSVDNNNYTLNKQNPDFSQFPPYFILIDEINRADLSKVFGELLFAIEDDYRGYENRFKLSSSAMETKDTAICWEDEQAYFFVPKNVYIRGTMNDIDRSVDSIDFAFRRRFKWVEKRYDDAILKEMLINEGYENLVDYIKSCRNLNKNIVSKISIADESFEIGHAIFRNIMKYTKSKTITDESKKQLFDNHIEPIVYNYLKMDYGNENKNLEELRSEFVK